VKTELTVILKNPSMFVYFRKRFKKSKLSDLNEVIVQKALEEEKKASEQKSSSNDHDQSIMMLGNIDISSNWKTNYQKLHLWVAP
jgi:hypothetical protein